MNTLRLKLAGDKLGTVVTTLPKCQSARDINSLTGDELAQLIVDVWTLPQTDANDDRILRPGEDLNLLKILFRQAKRRYGTMFTSVIAKAFMNSLAS